MNIQILSTIKNENKELAILASIYLYHQEVIHTLLDLGLEPKHFYSPIYSEIFKFAVEKSLDGKDIGIQDIPEKVLYSDNFTDIDYTNYKQDTLDVIELYNKRELAGTILLGLDMVEKGDTHDNIVNLLSDAISFQDNKVETIQDISFESYYNNRQEDKGIQLYFKTFDYAGVRLLNGQLIAVGADTGAGKTTFLINIMANQVKMGNKVLLFSLEQPVREIMMKFLTVLSGYSEEMILSGKAKEEDIRHWDIIIKNNVQIIYKDGMTIAELKSRAKILHSRYKFSVIGVDYWQLLYGTGKTKLEELVNTADGLLSLALSIDLPIITLAQVDKQSSRFNKLDRNAFSGSKQLSNNSSYIFMLQKDKETGEVVADIVKSRKPNHYGRSVKLGINIATERLIEKNEI